MNYVIVGNGPAGTSAVEAIREVDEKGKITVLSEEGIVNYSKPLITYLLGKKLKKDQMALRPESFYTQHHVQLLLKKKAQKLDVARKEVTLNPREKIPFDKLLIAAGGLPVSLPIEGRDAYGVFTFTTLRDAEELGRYIRTIGVESAVVIGGGLIGLKATEALMERGVRVTVVELADRILAATFDRQASALVEGALRKQKCQVLLENTVAKIQGDGSGRVKGVVLKDKSRVPCQLVVMAVGVVPNTELAKGTPLQVHRGILADATMQSSVRDIYSAGDCCEMRDMNGGSSRLIPIWPNAVKQGKVAGYNMAGKETEYEGSLSMNAVELCGIPTISVGLTDPQGDGFEVIVGKKEKGPLYKKIILQDDVIVGAIFVGDINRAGVYTGLIRNKVRVTDFKEFLLKEDFGLIYLPKEFRKHLVTGEEGMEV